MAVQQLPRGTRRVPARTGWAIEAERKARLEQIAAHVGVSAAVFLERMIEHLDEELTDRGVPVWWPAPEPKDGELPIDIV